MTTDIPVSTMDIMPTIIDLLNPPENFMMTAHEGGSILSFLDRGTPEGAHSIPFTMKGTALFNGNFKPL